MIDRISIWRRFDYILFAATLVLVVFGILMIDSATQDAIDDDIIRRVRDQINFAIVGFFVVIVMATIDYKLLGGLSPWLYAGMVILLLMVKVFGVEGAGGAKRWLNLGIRIQPSEIGKIIMIITLSQYVAERYLDLGKLSTVFRTMIHMAIPTALIFDQPDLGTTIVFSGDLGGDHLVRRLAIAAYRNLPARHSSCLSDSVSPVTALSALAGRDIYQSTTGFRCLLQYQSSANQHRFGRHFGQRLRSWPAEQGALPAGAAYGLHLQRHRA